MTVTHRPQKTKSIYLCGPMDGCTPEEMHGWRERFKNNAALSHSTEMKPYPSLGAPVSSNIVHQHFHFLDPTDRIYKPENPMSMATVRKIVLIDKYDIETANIVLANLTMMHKYRSVGSLMEIIYAFDKGKYVLTIVDPDKPISPWIIYHTTTLVHSELEAEEVLRRLM